MFKFYPSLEEIKDELTVRIIIIIFQSSQDQYFWSKYFFIFRDIYSSFFNF